MKIGLIILNNNEFARFFKIPKKVLFAIESENELESNLLFEKSNGDPREFIYSKYRDAKLKLKELTS